ncbi:hypothetical protein EYF80_019817 [Liparis tanakae]|uniref:Uncharacterized protein n=1 Tax=Liparis tanakae TaxID=230148 RepID=A0A4Z2HY54_9TELE|nr:hypothetical protein EYF80_019817 [Liparis tanakae]
MPGVNGKSSAPVKASAVRLSTLTVNTAELYGATEGSRCAQFVRIDGVHLDTVIALEQESIDFR